MTRRSSRALRAAGGGLLGLALLTLVAGPGVAGSLAAGASSTSAPATATTSARAAEDPTDAGGLDGYAPVMVVLDISGSMVEPSGQGNITKIQAARSAVVNLAGAIPAEQRFGLLSYPSDTDDVDAEGCSRGGVNIALGAPDPEQTSQVVAGLEPSGNTPTSPALFNAAAKLKASGAEHSVIVLVSDGMANCGPPVCETAKKIRAEGVELTVNTVGFDVAEDEGAREDLQCVADATGGSYASAGDPEGLREALQKAAASWLEVDATIPDQLRTAVGQGAQLGTAIPVTVTNTGNQPGLDVRVSMDFLEDRAQQNTQSVTGGSLLVPRPIRFLGNLAPGDSRTLSMEVRPPASAAGKDFSWVVTATTSKGEGNAATGTTTVLDSTTALGPVLSEANGSIVVLGDSYSSGEGARDYLAGTNGGGPDTNKCHRSNKAYAAVLFGAKRTKILACSGAVTANMATTRQSSGGHENVPLQISKLRDLAKAENVGAVLMTLGGNDIGFGELASKCAMFGTGCDPFFITAMLGSSTFTRGLIGFIYGDDPGPGPIGQESIDLVNAMGASLWKVYGLVDNSVNNPTAVKARGGKVAPIIVLPYVRILPPTDTEGCLAGVSKVESGVLNSITGHLNSTLSILIGQKARDGRPFYFADDVEGAFLPDHTVCAEPADQYANTVAPRHGQLKVGDKNELAHPNAVGYRAEAEALAGWSAQAKPIKSSPIDVNDDGMPSWLQNVLGVPQVGDFVPANGSIAMAGDGFAPGSPVSMTLASQPQVLGFAVADSNGRTEMSVRLPHDLPPGRHHLYLRGVNDDGTHVVTRGLWVMPQYSLLAFLVVLAGVGLLVLAWVRSRRG